MNAAVLLILAFIALVSGCTTDADCQDGIYCNGQEQCIGSACTPASALPCPFYTECIDLGSNTGMCLAFTGCMEYPKMCVDGTYCNRIIDTCLPTTCSTDEECSDYTPCTGDEKCVLGNCTNADPSTWICENPLFCNPVSLNCTRCTSASQCDDGVSCNGIEVCSPDGECVSGQPICTEPGYMCNETLGVCEMTIQIGSMIIIIALFIMGGVAILSVVFFLFLKYQASKRKRSSRILLK